MARKDVDTLLGYLGHPGRYQVVLFFLVMWQYLPMCFNCLAMIMIGGKPSQVRCAEVSLAVNATTQSCRTELDLTGDTAIAECSKYEVISKENTLDYSNSSDLKFLCSNCPWEYQFDDAAERTVISEVLTLERVGFLIRIETT